MQWDPRWSSEMVGWGVHVMWPGASCEKYLQLNNPQELKGVKVTRLTIGLEVQSVIEVRRELQGRKGEERNGRISKSLK